MKGRVLRFFFLLYFGAFGCIEVTRGSERRCEPTATYNKHFLHENYVECIPLNTIDEALENREK